MMKGDLMRITAFLVATTVLLSSQFGHAAQLDLAQGTQSLSGSLSLTINPVENHHRFLIAPSYSYFATENVEVAVGLKYQTDIGVETTSYLGANLGIFGYLDLGSLMFKSGASVGFVSYMGSGDSPTIIELTVPISLVVPLSNAVALYCGTNLEIQFRPGGGANVLIPVGLLGFQAFF